MAYKISERYQMTFLPPAIEDCVNKEDPVRVYDAFVEALNFQELGIAIEPIKAGAHEYYPKDMIKLLIYGYSYGERSSRKLERACYHNLSFIWLLGGLKPDYRTIARFRSKYKEAIKKVLKQCVRLCIEFDLIEGNTLFIDGSPFRANASIKNTWTKERCQRHLKKIDEHIEKLIEESERIDEEEKDKGSLVKIEDELREKKRLKERVQDVLTTFKGGDKRLHNTTDSDCVKVNGRRGTQAGYNAQIVVDEKNGLIVHSEALSSSQDANEFRAQVNKASEVLEKKPKVVSADSGYESLKDLEKIDKDITIVVPSQRQIQEEHGHALGPFDKERFRYDADRDEYICPEDKRLKYFGYHYRRRVRQYRAKGEECRGCKYFGMCTKSNKGRMVIRLEHEELMQKLRAIYESPEGQKIYKLRSQRVELPFGHIKRNLGAGQFLLRGKAKVDAELAILATCFNIARMITLIGIPALVLRLNGG